MQGALLVNPYSYASFHECSDKIIHLHNLVSFIYVWPHEEDFMVL